MLDHLQYVKTKEKGFGDFTKRKPSMFAEIDRRGRGPDQEKVFCNAFLAIPQHAREHKVCDLTMKHSDNYNMHEPILSHTMGL